MFQRTLISSAILAAAFCAFAGSGSVANEAIIVEHFEVESPLTATDDEYTVKPGVSVLAAHCSNGDSKLSVAVQANEENIPAPNCKMLESQSAPTSVAAGTMHTSRWETYFLPGQEYTCSLKANDQVLATITVKVEPACLGNLLPIDLTYFGEAEYKITGATATWNGQTRQLIIPPRESEGDPRSMAFLETPDPTSSNVGSLVYRPYGSEPNSPTQLGHEDSFRSTGKVCLALRILDVNNQPYTLSLKVSANGSSLVLPIKIEPGFKSQHRRILPVDAVKTDQTRDNATKVAVFEQRLRQLGFVVTEDTTEHPVDGFFGTGTQNVLQQFRKAAGYEVDGEDLTPLDAIWLNYDAAPCFPDEGDDASNATPALEEATPGSIVDKAVAIESIRAAINSLAKQLGQFDVSEASEANGNLASMLGTQFFSPTTEDAQIFGDNLENQIVQRLTAIFGEYSNSLTLAELAASDIPAEINPKTGKVTFHLPHVQLYKTQEFTFKISEPEQDKAQPKTSYTRAEIPVDVKVVLDMDVALVWDPSNESDYEFEVKKCTVTAKAIGEPRLTKTRIRIGLLELQLEE